MLTDSWKKSSRSNDGGADNCVEARLDESGTVQVRDTKLGAESPIFSLSQSDWLSVLSTGKQ